MNALALCATVVAALVCVPCAIVALECLAACLPPRRERVPLVRVPSTVVLVPAHDEEDCLPDALRSLAAELGDDDRIVVVAHNCTDRTAMIARARGAEVVEVRDDGTGGKPAALQAGVRALDEDPPEIVVIVDADCRVEPGTIRALAVAAAAHDGPVQGDYRFDTGSDDDFGSLSSLALLVKNVVRPLGLARLGLPCLLNGAGSAYPFAQLRAAPQGKGSIAEDYQLAIDLALRGHAPRFVPAARVRSILPARHDVALRQRRRWEHGHLALVLRTAPGLVVRGLLRFDRDLLALGVDLLVPPLAFLVLCLLACIAFAVAVFLAGGGALALWIGAAGAALLASGLACAVARFAGRRALADVVVRVPGYILGKLALYSGFFGKRETRWRKTERPSAPPPPGADDPGHGRSRTGT